MRGWTENGRLWVGHDGFIYWFKKSGALGRSVTLTHLENLDEEGDDIPGDGFVLEDLPAPVRKALKEENVRFQATKATLEGAMS